MFDTRFIGALAFAALGCTSALAAAADINPPPTAKDWADIAKLPDWSGVWNVNETLQNAEITKNPTPWTPVAAKKIAAMLAEEKAGHPEGLYVNCLPEGMPTWMMIYHNAFEFLFTPSRVTILGEADGNGQRRIYTDGRGHPKDPDPTFYGHSIGHWEGGTLVVDTVGVMPEVRLSISEAAGVPNNGDMHIVERMHLAAADEFHDDLLITAPHILTKPWATTRIAYRQRARKYDIVPGVCLQGDYTSVLDKNGDHVLVKAQTSGDGLVLPP
jgi:hypothetical protein